ncbi:hypothetical protein [Salirhabdus salicampi]|uniref:hypothetical protein n=1 Tax=Salirhabdus salicampi TaxID=476102 RepID=UPI0020C51EBA|nr:hypothetical protein [Salirhabdus salicampi]MCP8616330.1 hypothetical protein [Salirhabdus salicampi]
MLQLWVNEGELRKMIVGLCIVTFIATVAIILIAKEKHNKTPYMWLIAHFIIGALSLGWGLNSLNPELYTSWQQSIALQTFTVQMYFVAFGWIISVVCLVVGVSLFQK